MSAFCLHKRAALLTASSRDIAHSRHNRYLYASRRLAEKTSQITKNELIASTPNVFESTPQVVVASNFTSALDVLRKLAVRNGWGSLRLDGGTATDERQHLVDRFNRTRAEELFLFLLSAKAGGVGLNL